MTNHPVRRGALLPLFVLLLVVLSTSLPAQEWRALGPWGGYVYSLTHDSVTGSTLGTSGMWIWRLSDELRAWDPLRSIFSFPSPASVTRLIPASDGVYMLGYSTTISFTTDGGETWSLQHTMEESRGQMPQLIVVGDTLYMSTSRPVLMASGDHGVTWVKSDTIPSALRTFTTDGSDLYMSGFRGFYRRQENGGWQNLGLAGNYDATAWIRGDTIVHWGDVTRLQISVDRGVQWRSLPDSGLIALTLHGRLLYMINDDGLYAMPIDGAIWERLTSMASRPFRYPSLFGREDDLVIADIYGVWQWDFAARRLLPLVDGLNAVATKGILRRGDTLLAPSNVSLFYSADDGATWMEREKPLFQANDLYALSGSTVVATAVQADSLFVSEDWGASWQAHEIDADTSFQPRALYATEELLVVAGRALYRSDDRGVRWQKTEWPPAWGVIVSLTGEDHLLFAATATMPTRLFRSIDAGSTWDSIPLADSTSMGGILEYNDGVLYFGSFTRGTRGLFRSTDLGESWEPVDYDFPRGFDGIDSVTMITGVDVYGDTLFVTVADPMKGVRQLFMSIDRGTRWRELALPESFSMAGTIAPDGDRLLLVTGDRGLFATTFNLGIPMILSSPTGESDVLRLTTLPDGHLRWAAPRDAPYRLDLYTLTGEHITLIADGKAAAGTHALRLDDLPAGAYLCVLHCGGESAAVVVTAR